MDAHILNITCACPSQPSRERNQNLFMFSFFVVYLCVVSVFLLSLFSLAFPPFGAEGI